MKNFLLPSINGLALSASVSDKFCFLGVRSSGRSLSGFVTVCGFSTRRVARRFAQVWSDRLPCFCGGCAVRHRSGRFLVSVPVDIASVPGTVRSGGKAFAQGAAETIARSVAGSPRFQPFPALPAPAFSLPAVDAGLLFLPGRSARLSRSSVLCLAWHFRRIASRLRSIPVSQVPFSKCLRFSFRYAWGC